ncbi:MAG: DUF4231 domain-containing protein [Saprospiraceae bacterium]|nr:DUF4231 domain-containing protein [Saprospiraceae bacterium]
METRLDEKSYIEQRVQDQINWLEGKSAFNQRWYKLLKRIVLLSSLLIPFLTGFLEENLFWLKVTIGALGVIIAFCEGLLSLNKYHDNWLQYRSTTEDLKREQFLYKTNAAKYAELDNPFQKFVIEIESILSKENAQWKENWSDTEAGKP